MTASSFIDLDIVIIVCTLYVDTQLYLNLCNFLFVPYWFYFSSSQDIRSTMSDDTSYMNSAFPGICTMVLGIK